MSQHDFGELNISQLTQSFLARKYMYSTLINVTDNESVVLLHNNDTKPLFSYKNTYTHVVDNSDKYVHPMFVKQFKEYFSLENLDKAYDEDTELSLLFLHFMHRDHKYHWVTQRMTPVHDNTGHKVFICTTTYSDEEKARDDKNRQEMFNQAVVGQLIYNYHLVHVVELENSMSRLVHSGKENFYREYELRFPTHLAMMNHLCKNFVEERKKADFQRLCDYKYVKSQFDSGVERLVLAFNDNRNLHFLLVVSPYPDYSADNALAIYAIKEIEVDPTHDPNA